MHPTDNEDLISQKIVLSEIDKTTKGPAILFLSCAIFWLIVGTMLALVASLKLQHPNFLANVEWLTFGRARAAHLNAVAFGWLNNAIFASSLWIMARLSQRELMHGGLLYVAGVFWNVAVTAGVIGILAGGITSVEWLEMPPYLAPIIALSYALVGVWGVLSFWHRRNEHVYVSQWYILAALFWFPWLYTVVQIIVFWFPARGTVQAITNWWFGHNVLGLWYTPHAVATAYYLIPKVLGRPIYSYYLSLLGFWSLALFYNWAGVHHLIGGPIPLWLTSAGTVASIMMVIPVLVTGINHHTTVYGHFDKVWRSPTLRFVVFGAMSYTLASFAGSAMALREVNLVTHFTHLTVGHAHHGAYAFVTMIMFGSIYFMMPRLLQREWPFARLIHVHFWGTALGITLMVVALHIGGWIQGMEMNNPDIPFLETVQHTKIWLVLRTIAGILIFIGHIAFAINFITMLVRKSKNNLNSMPTLFESKATINA